MAKPIAPYKIPFGHHAQGGNLNKTIFNLNGQMLSSGKNNINLKRDE
jgi:hypothetical protein